MNQEEILTYYLGTVYDSAFHALLYMAFAIFALIFGYVAPIPYGTGYFAGGILFCIAVMFYLRYRGEKDAARTLTPNPSPSEGEGLGEGGESP